MFSQFANVNRNMPLSRAYVNGFEDELASAAGLGKSLARRRGGL
jgi:hypothetical protein